MAKKFTEDQLNWILSVNSTEAQQGIQALTKSNRELEKSNKERRQEMIKLEMQGKTETEAYKNLTAVVKQNDTQIKSNRALMKGLESTIGLTSLTMYQLKKQAQDLQRQMDNTSKALHPAEYEKLQTQLVKVKDRMDDLKNAGKKTEDTLGKTILSKGTVATFLGNMYTKAAEKLGELVMKAKEFVAEGIKMAGMAQGVERAFNRISNPETLSELREATKGTVNNLELMKAAVQANNFNIPLAELGTLLRFAQQRAQETGESVEYLTNSIVTGIGRKSPLILDNLGISAVKLNEEFAKTGDFAKAVGTIVRQELAKSGESIDTAADKAQQRAALLQNIQMSIGQRMIGSVNSVGTAWTSFLDVINRWVNIPTVEKLRDEQRETNVLARSIMAAEGRTEARNLLIKEMQRQYPSFLANLDMEKLTNEQLAERLRDVNKEYENRIRNQVLNDKVIAPLEEKQKALIEEQVKGITELNEIAEKYPDKLSKGFVEAIQSGEVLKMSSKDIQKEMSVLQPKVIGLSALAGSVTTAITGNILAGQAVTRMAAKSTGLLTSDIEHTIERLTKIPSELDSIGEKIESTTNQIVNFGKKASDVNPVTEPKGLLEQYEKQRKKLLDERLKATEDTVIREKNIEIKALDEKMSKLQNYGVEQKKTTKSSQKNPYEKELKAVDALIADKKLKLSQSYTDGLIMQDEYNKQLEELELESLNRKLEIYGIGSQERTKIEQQILDYKIRLMEIGFNEYIKNIDKEAKADRKQEKQKKEHIDNLNKILQEQVANISQQQEQELALQIESDKKRTQSILDFSAQAGAILGESLTDSETSFADAMGNILLMTLDALRQTVTMSIAQTTIRNVSTLGFLGLAKAAAEIALINVAFGAIKGLIKKPSASTAKNTTGSSSDMQAGKRVVTGKQSGGYLDVARAQDGKEFNAELDPGKRGFVDKPTVIVGEGPAGNSREWVASNAALENPTVAPFINVLNDAQEKGVIRTVDMNQMMRKRLAGFEQGGSISPTLPPAAPTTKSPSDSIIGSAQIEKLNALLQKFDKEGLRAYVVYSDIERKKQTLDKTRRLGGK